ncbi:putative carbonic anhydrase, partial [Operophtera brumata]
MTTSRANTLLDDADDLQKQLKNEANDKMKGEKTLLRRHGVEEWDYKEQSKWGLKYPDCVLRSQSPVDLPYSGLRKVTRTRQMLFKNHEVLPERSSDAAKPQYHNQGTLRPRALSASDRKAVTEINPIE